MEEHVIRWGILGVANIAKNAVIPGIVESKTGVVSGVASRSLEKSQELVKELNQGRAYGSYQELLDDPSIDAVYIPLPNHLHKEWVIRAAKAKKHILCEKPIALTTEEVKEMKQACLENEVLLFEAFMYRHQERYRKIQSHINNGDIGEVRGIRSSFSFNNAQALDNFRMKPEYGGGSLYDVGVYPLSLARMILKDEPEAVTVHSFTPESHNGVDMVASGLVEFSNGRFLTFDCGMWSAFRNDAEILGTKGRIVIEDAFTDGLKGFSLIIGNETNEIEVADTNHYAKQVDFLARVLRKETGLIYDIEDSILNMKVLDACLQSQKNRERVVL
ncbi:Gfo/Idh/MocA family protein [Alkalihalobacillus pseudalcaliphilus]|uniref:Gfo/Idh/MocA family protein n=1 Tax=Alkalihalobacillus pseudalcaliphilus TaxID=79884 RepID=UPI00064DE2DA|nr:Gfo/Idh/MocA family oxidoreductase [Alkalihalobacillus pseudalcaliphilus]KMK75087.1 oxidoreductase [Alkalihalobacillus pseudalcaliphilus]